MLEYLFFFYDNVSSLTTEYLYQLGSQQETDVTVEWGKIGERLIMKGLLKGL